MNIAILNEEGYSVGDVNKDGVINVLDASYMSKYFAGWEGYDIPAGYGDFNNDGILNRADITYLQQYLARWYDFETIKERSDINLDRVVDYKDLAELTHLVMISE